MYETTLTKHLAIAFVFAVSLLAATNVHSATNIAMSQFLNDIRGTSFNMLVSMPQVVVKGKKKKTRRAIRKGYVQAGQNMQILLRKLNLNALLRNPSGQQDIPQFKREDIETGRLLEELISLQTTEWEKRLSADINIEGKDKTEDLAQESSEEDFGLSDDIGADLDIDTSLFETTDDEVTVDNAVTTPGKLAEQALLEIGRLYAKQLGGVETYRMVNGSKKSYTLSGQVMGLHDIYSPYNLGGTLEVLPVHAVFGAAFMPEKKGAIHFMRMYVFVIVNDPEIDKVRVAAKPIPQFRWDRNNYYISAATGSVLRTVFSEALGAKVEDI